MIRKGLGADIERIETVIHYSGSYNEIVDQGHREVQRGYMPEIRPLSCNLNDYD